MLYTNSKKEVVTKLTKRHLYFLIQKCSKVISISECALCLLGMLRVGRVTGRVGSTNFYSGPGRVGSANFEISTGRAGSGQRFQKFPRVGSGHG